eukprot:5487597-Amphidinium_carterae.1
MERRVWRHRGGDEKSLRGSTRSTESSPASQAHRWPAERVKRRVHSYSNAQYSAEAAHHRRDWAS